MIRASRRQLLIAASASLLGACSTKYIVENEPQPKKKKYEKRVREDTPLADPKDVLDKPVPPLDLHRLGSEEQIRLYQLHDKIVVMHFVATWNKDSGESLIKMDKLVAGLANRNVVLLIVAEDADESVERVHDFVAVRSPESLTALDVDHKLGRSLGVSELPASVVLDGEGIVRLVIPGPMPKAFEQVQDKVLSLMKKK